MGHGPNGMPKHRLGIIGFGAFGRLTARHLQPHFDIVAHDPALTADDLPSDLRVKLASLAETAACGIVVLAVPVSALAGTIDAIAADLRPGALVLDVGSVKVGPSQIMLRRLPLHVDIVATHPLFGPQSARDGLRGLKIALCPLRGDRHREIAHHLRRVLKLHVIVTTPEAHDRDAALAQGLTHLIAKVLFEMEPLPTRITTKSFDLLCQAAGMVRYDAPAVFDAIERANPYSAKVRHQFFDYAGKLARDLERGADDGPSLSVAAAGDTTCAGEPVLRGLDEDLIAKLKLRAARHGRSAEAEHCEILRQALKSEAEPSIDTPAGDLPKTTVSRTQARSEVATREARGKR